MGRPVLVHSDCAVTAGHVQRSQGGATFSTYGEFATIVDWMLANPQETAVLGQNGKMYVATNYDWDAIIDHFLKTITSWDM